MGGIDRARGCRERGSGRVGRGGGAPRTMPAVGDEDDLPPLRGAREGEEVRATMGEGVAEPELVRGPDRRIIPIHPDHRCAGPLIEQEGIGCAGDPVDPVVHQVGGDDHPVPGIGGRAHRGARVELGPHQGRIALAHPLEEVAHDPHHRAGVGTEGGLDGRGRGGRLLGRQGGGEEERREEGEAHQDSESGLLEIGGHVDGTSTPSDRIQSDPSTGRSPQLPTSRGVILRGVHALKDLRAALGGRHRNWCTRGSDAFVRTGLRYKDDALNGSSTMLWKCAPDHTLSTFLPADSRRYTSA